MDTDKHNLELDRLVAIFEQTQSAMQRQAARSVDVALVVRKLAFRSAYC